MDIWQVLRRHEGIAFTPYCDLCGGKIVRYLGHWRCDCAPFGEVAGEMTIGIGHNLSARPLTETQVQDILGEDVAAIVGELGKLAWFDQLDPIRAQAITDMAFTMGVVGVQGFREMIDSLMTQDWGAAADAIIQSKWAREAPTRAAEDAAAIRTGAWVLA